MNTRKTLIASAVMLTLGNVYSIGAQAALTTSATLQFTAGATYCTASNAKGKCIATDVNGTYFSMDISGDGTVQASEKTPFAPGLDGGIVIGVLQDTNGHVSHTGAPHAGVGGIDSEWGFFGNSGMVFTTVPITVVTDSGATKTLDFTGWTVTWNAIPVINMGGDTANFPGDTGLATITCSASSCSGSSTFTLNYAAHVPLKDVSNFGGVAYGVHMVGHVVDAPAAVVPVPATVWLMGSGLLGLVGVARRKKQ